MSSSIKLVPLRLPMTGRDPHETGRAATPLELFFDLIFVVAIAANAAELHHDISAGHPETILGYACAWLAIWWAWMGYTWFASAYDNDDVVFRLWSFVIMAGLLCLAAGVPDLFEDGQSTLAVVGYAIMRFAMVALWLRAARDDAAGRTTAQRYALGIFVVQLFWIARLWFPSEPLLIYGTFALGFLFEILVPIWAESARHTPFHPHHIAERYGLMTIIVLGEVVLSSVQAIQKALVTPAPGGGGHADSAGTASMSPDIYPLIAGGLLLVFSLWWLYFKREFHGLAEHPQRVWLFGYGHLPIFSSVATVGVGLAVGIDVELHEAVVGATTVGMVIGLSVAIFATMLAILGAVSDGNWRDDWFPALPVIIAVLVVPFLGLSVGWTVLAQGVIVSLGAVHHVVHSQRAGVSA